MHEREAHHSAFCLRGAGQRQQILQRLFVWAIRGRLLWRLLRLQLKPQQARQALEREYLCTYGGGAVPFDTCESGWGVPALRASGRTPAQIGS